MSLLADSMIEHDGTPSRVREGRELKSVDAAMFALEGVLASMAQQVMYDAAPVGPVLSWIVVKGTTGHSGQQMEVSLLYLQQQGGVC